MDTEKTSWCVNIPYFLSNQSRVAYYGRRGSAPYAWIQEKWKKLFSKYVKHIQLFQSITLN